MKWIKLIDKVPPEKNKDYAARRNGYYGELHTGPDFILFRNLQGTKELAYTDLQDTEWLDESPSAPLADADELWDEFSEHIDDDIFSLETVAGSTVMRKNDFYKMMEKIGLRTPPSK